MIPLRRSLHRLRRECLDALELVLVPGLAIILPWQVAFGLFSWIARRPWLYRDACLGAVREAKARGGIEAQETAAWMAERRLVTILDHADHYLFRWRSDRWLRRFVDVQGKWQAANSPGLLVTFHWGLGLWCLRHAALAGLHPHMLVASLDGPRFKERWILSQYIRARMATVERASGRPVIIADGGLPHVKRALDVNEQVLVVLDVPADQVAKTCEVKFMNRAIQVPRVLPGLAVERDLPVTVILMNVDLSTGRRVLSLEKVEPGTDGAALAQKLFTHLERAIMTRPASWHLWDQAQRFFASNPG